MSDFIQNLADEIQVLSAGKDVFVFGLSGPDTAGKSTLTSELSEKLKDCGKQIVVIGADWFHFPKAERRASPGTEPEQFVHHTINFDRLIEEVLQPLELGTKLITFEHFDVDEDKGYEESIALKKPLIVLLEGIFLFQPKLLPFLDFKVYLRVDEKQALVRARARDSHRPLFYQTLNIEDRYREKYLPGQALHRKLHDPEANADWIVDNTNWENPKILVQNND